MLYDPAFVPEKLIYSSAEHELVEAARDSNVTIKPAWVLRRNLDEKLTADTTPDWRVKASARLRHSPVGQEEQGTRCRDREGRERDREVRV